MKYTTKHDRVWNFSAGPANLPLSVLEKVQSDLLNYGGSGMSVMEMSHRCKSFDAILENAESRLRKILNISDDYAVLFLQGGASMQFAMAPMNLYREGHPMEAIHTGYWTQKAIQEMKTIGEVKVVASADAEQGFRKLPEVNESMFNPDASFVHICSNNTIAGTQWQSFPKVGKAPLVADMSSDILSRRLNIEEFGLIYAGAQKNIGPAGMAIVIIRKDLAEQANKSLPTYFQYASHIEGGSRFHTPPTFAIYVAGLVFDWIDELGGLEAMEKLNQEKANLLYGALEESSLFYSTVEKTDRSLMNVVFRAEGNNEALEAKLISEATAAGLTDLKGHRSVGGLRASIYNAMPIEGVQALVEFLREFEKKNH
jgi:phosphoserine aminotransferase